MNTHRHPPKAARVVRAAASAALLTLGAAPFFQPTPARAADPYDAVLEKRIEALERELNVMSNDDKGKNVQASSTEVPTFLRAAGKEVQGADHLG